MTSDIDAARTYAPGRAPRRAGLAGLGPVGTGAGLVLLAIAAGMSVITPIGAVIFAAIGAAVMAPLAIRIRGRSGAQILAARISWWRSCAARRHLYRTGIASRLVGSHQLPGLLASTQLWSVEDGRDGRIGVIVAPYTRHYTVVVSCEVEDADLADQHAVEARVARYATWLASLGNEPDLVQAQVIVETAPDDGSRLQRELDATTLADAPTVATQVLQTIARTYPAASADVAVYIAATYRNTDKRGHESACVTAVDRIPFLTGPLAGSGAVAVTPMAPEPLIRLMRTVYDPADARHIESTPPQYLSWDQAGPVASEEHWDCYRHDSGWSRTFGMVAGPAGTVFARTFSRLTDPIPGVTRKRVCLMYLPYTPERAAHQVESDRLDAAFNSNKTSRPSARDMVDVAATEQAAAEEAQGAGMEQYTLIATVTTRDRPSLEEASAALLARAGEVRTRLRVMYGSQAPSFAAGLPAGVVLPEHATLPHIGHSRA